MCNTTELFSLCWIEHNRYRIGEHNIHGTNISLHKSTFSVRLLTCLEESAGSTLLKMLFADLAVSFDSVL